MTSKRINYLFRVQALEPENLNNKILNRFQRQFFIVNGICQQLRKVNQTVAERRTGTRGQFFMPPIESQSLCAFVELPHLLEKYCWQNSVELIPLQCRVGAINAPRCGQSSQSLAKEISHCVTCTENVLRMFPLSIYCYIVFTILSSLYNCWESNV